MTDPKPPRKKIGSGITERDFTGDLYARRTLDPSAFGNFNVPWAWKVLWRAVKIPPGVPDDRLQDFVYKESRLLVGKILRGETEYRPHEHAEWYAARLLIYIQTVGRLLIEGKAADAVAEGICLGMLAREAELKFQFEDAVLAHVRSREGAAKGGSKKKRVLAVLGFIRARLRKNPRATATALWNLIPADEFSAVLIRRKAKEAKLFRDLGQLVVIEKRPGVIREEFGDEHKGMVWVRVAVISRPSFTDYVGAVRKARTR